MESPAVPVPLDPREQPILERLLRTRDALLLLKQDKSSYIKSRDVLPLYEEVIGERPYLKEGFHEGVVVRRGKV